MKLKNSNCNETQKSQIVMKLKNSNCDLKKKLKISKYDETQKLNCDKIQKLKLQWKSKTKIVIKLRKS